MTLNMYQIYSQLNKKAHNNLIKFTGNILPKEIISIIIGYLAQGEEHTFIRRLAIIYYWQHIDVAMYINKGSISTITFEEANEIYKQEMSCGSSVNFRYAMMAHNRFSRNMFDWHGKKFE